MSQGVVPILKPSQTSPLRVRVRGPFGNDENQKQKKFSTLRWGRVEWAKDRSVAPSGSVVNQDSAVVVHHKCSNPRLLGYFWVLFCVQDMHLHVLAFVWICTLVYACMCEKLVCSNWIVPSILCLVLRAAKLQECKGLSNLKKNIQKKCRKWHCKPAVHTPSG